MKQKGKYLKRIMGLFTLLASVLAVGVFRSPDLWSMVRIIWDREAYPASLVSLAWNNPEARGFVLDYPDYKESEREIDLTEEVVQGEVPLFLQWDRRWGYRSYGQNFLAVNGCGPTCLAMVYCGLTGDTTRNPYSIAVMAQERGYYVKGAGTSWAMMSDMAGELGLTVHEVIYDEPHIRAFLEEGHPIICSMGPGDFTSKGHFIVLVGLDEMGRVIVNDPNSKENSEKAWDLNKVIPQMKNLWGYS